MPRSRDALVIFARAPELGRVKTRLAAELGAARALAIYRQLARTVVDAVRGADAQVVVAHAPASASPAMRAWLGEDLAYEPQVEGDLGARMAAAVRGRLAAGAQRVVVIGTDCPGMTANLVSRAFDALQTADVVLGPAADGGYYLVGATEAHHALFRDIPWSTDRTLAVTRDRLREADLTVHLLEPLRDVDTADDWRAYETERVGIGE